MSKMQIIGVIAIVVGFFLVGFAANGTRRMMHARNKVNNVSAYVPRGSAKQVVKHRIFAKIDSYQVPVALSYVIGGVLMGGGIVAVSVCRHKKKPAKRTKK